MALTDIPPIFIGDPVGPFKGNLTQSTHTLNGTTDRVFWVFQPELAPGVSAITVTRLGFNQGTATGAQPTFRISLQGVDTSGNPDGTVLGGGSPASATFTPSSGNNNSWVSVTLANSVSLSRGVWYALVIDYSSGTIGGSNSLGVRYSLGVSTTAYLMPAYSAVDDAGSISKFGAGTPIFGYGTASRWYGRPMSSSSTLGINSTTSPNEYAIAFNLPTTFGSKFAVAGVIPNLQWAAGHTELIQLYTGTGASDTTPVQGVTIDTDHVGGIRPAVMFDESSLTELSFGSGYRIGFAPQSSTNQPIFYIDVADVSHWDAWPGGQWFWASHRAGGNWTDITTRRICCDLMINGWQASAGGGIIRTGMNGGFL